MQELSREKNNLELKIDHLEDLWILSQYISTNDIIYSTTKRKVAIGNDKTKQVTKIMYVELKVQKVTFDTDILRVQGEILNENEFTAVGQSHTVSFLVSDTVKISKYKILNFEEKLLKKAIESKHSLNLGVLMDKDELIAFEFSPYGYKVLVHEKNLGSKKGYATITIDDNNEKYEHIKPLLERSYSTIILAGPGKFKNSLSQYISSKSYDSLTFDFSDVDSVSIPKCIAKISKSNILDNSEIAREEEYVQEFLKRLNSPNSLCAYGEDAVISKINEANVENLLITTKFINKKKDDGSFLDFQEYLTLVEQLQGDIIMIHSKHSSGQIIDGLGGIVSLSRY